jgi:hypothetical protein
MAKQHIKLSIDENILELVKDTIPNISGFVEECFKAYLMISGLSEQAKGEELRKAWETFRESQLRIHLLTKINYEQQYQEKLEEKVKTDAWLNVWRDYRRTGTTQDNKIEESSEIIGITTQELKKVLNETYADSKNNMENLHIYDEWNYIEETILPTITIYENEEEGDLDALLSGKVDLN